MSTAPAASSEPVGSTPATPTRRRRWIRPVVAVGVVAAVIVAGLFAVGVLPWGTGGPSSPYLTFSGAASNAQSASGSVAGGPWYVSIVISLLSRSSILEPTQNVSGFLTDSNCSYDWPHGEPANLAVPATPTSAGAGSSAYWVVGLKNQSNGLLLETISDGSASALVTIHAGYCAEVAGYLVQFPSASVDSPSVVASVNAAGGGSFLINHPNATQLWGAVGGISLGVLGATTPEWYVEYTSCTFPAISGETGAFFNATVAGLTGEVISNHTGTTACTLGPPGGFTDAAFPPSSPAAARQAI